jgi:putative phosphonate metabolism protein
MRYAVYFTPAADDPLTIAAQSWLGRNAFTGEPVAAPVPAGFSDAEFRRITEDPRRYGFHATLVAPFGLNEWTTQDDLARAADAFAEGFSPFSIPALNLSLIGSFFALTPVESRDVDALASATVDHFGPLRAPLTSAEIERRRPDLLTPRQRAYLDRFGYPYVKDEFRFHMTLTGSLDPDTAARVEPALQAHCAPLLDRPVAVDSIALFVEPEPGAAFTVHSIHPFSASRARRSD